MYDNSLKNVTETYIKLCQERETSNLTESKYIQDNDYDLDILIFTIKGPSGYIGEITYSSMDEYSTPKETLAQLKDQIKQNSPNNMKDWAKLGFKKDSELKALSKEISKYTEIFK
jgi:hypothetical protein